MNVPKNLFSLSLPVCGAMPVPAAVSSSLPLLDGLRRHSSSSPLRSCCTAIGFSSVFWPLLGSWNQQRLLATLIPPLYYIFFLLIKK
jgi:hypothetical protein